MIYIIKSQQGRSVGEITFDHYNDRSQSTITRSKSMIKFNFKRDEKRIDRSFKIISFIILPFIYFLWPFFFPYPEKYAQNDWKKLGHRFINWSIMLSLVSTFSYLYWLTNKYHKFEFETGQKQMVCFFVNTLIFMLI